MSNPAASALVVVVAVTAMMFNFSLHKIDEGNVGVYYRVRDCFITTPHPSFNNYFFQGRCLIESNEQSWLPHDDTLPHNSPISAGKKTNQS